MTAKDQKADKASGQMLGAVQDGQAWALPQTSNLWPLIADSCFSEGGRNPGPDHQLLAHLRERLVVAGFLSFREEQK